jgi:8-oxo-dGTP pyrophosphatase MutT (NUDIX family)
VAGMLDALRAALEPDPRPVAAPGDRLAAVLLPLVLGDEPSILFTRRREDMSRHPGEISFPGGLPHDEDDSLATTALRETHEEIGILPSEVRLLGALPPVHTMVSSILVVPFVGSMERVPDLRPSPAEIAEVLEYGVDALLEAESAIQMERAGSTFTGYVFDMDGSVIWGATARMLHSFLEIVKGVG